MITKAPIPVAIGDSAEMRKPHPCGSNRWEVTRIGVDIGLKCDGCGHRVMIPRSKFEKALKRLLPKE